MPVELDNGLRSANSTACPTQPYNQAERYAWTGTRRSHCPQCAYSYSYAYAYARSYSRPCANSTCAEGEYACSTYSVDSRLTGIHR